MAKLVINIGTVADDHTGDPLRTAFDKCNLNFTELYNAILSSGYVANQSIWATGAGTLDDDSGFTRTAAGGRYLFGLTDNGSDKVQINGGMQVSDVTVRKSGAASPLTTFNAVGAVGSTAAHGIRFTSASAGAGSNRRGGAVTLVAGSGDNDTGGAANLTAGSASGVGVGGIAAMFGGAATGTAAGGNAGIAGGDAASGAGGVASISGGASSGAGAGGDVILTGGSSASGQGGHVNLVPGTGATPGQVRINGTEITEYIQDSIGTIFANGGGLTWTYNDGAPSISAVVSITSASVSDFNEAAQDAVGNILTNGGGITWTYSDVGNTISATVSITSASVTDFAEAAQDAVGAALTNGGGLTWTYNDGVNTISAAVSITSASVTDFTEAVQDILGAILIDTNTIDFTYNDGANSLTIDARTQMSITSDGSGLKLQNDSASPGANKVYGTDGSGNKGWKADPGGGSGSFAITEIEVNLGSTPAWRGKFTITDAGISATSKIQVWQAPGPYTGKGTRADECEMDWIDCHVVPGAGAATVHWRSVEGYSGNEGIDGYDKRAIVIGRVRGNMKFHYVIG